MTQDLKIEDINCSGGGPSVGPPGPWGQGSLGGGSARVSTSHIRDVGFWGSSGGTGGTSEVCKVHWYPTPCH